uniref:DENN domain containing 4B n=1 Tax=Leptobrachium leishanense TaxID=445787 RepID=A0A8C5QSU3_9ANUR
IMEEGPPKLVDYFVVAGLTPSSRPLEEEKRPARPAEPVTDVVVIVRALSEEVPQGFTCIECTLGGHPADLNSSLLNNQQMYLCYRRGRDKPPITELGIYSPGKENLRSGFHVIDTTPYSHSANLNSVAPGNQRAFLTYKRTSESLGVNTLGVMDICIINPSKGESVPHTFSKVDRSLNTGMFGSALFLCYKKAIAKTHSLVYEAGLISRFPETDSDAFPLPELVPIFCLPMGSTIESWPVNTKYHMPVFSTFVLTGASGEKAYGAAIQFYEPYPRDLLSERQCQRLGLLSVVNKRPVTSKSVQTKRSICVLSCWPFFDVFQKFLTFIYRYSISGPHVLPIERHISNFMFNVPFPSPQRPRILVQVCTSPLLMCPVMLVIRCSGASYVTLLQNLGPENAVALLLAVLIEQKLLVHSQRPDVLTSVGEALVSIIFPLRWQCPYIPLCPLSLSDVLCAPVPFIVGIHSSYFDLHDPPQDVLCVDLDTNTLFQSEDKKLPSTRTLPRKPCKVLLHSLTELHKQLDEMYNKPLEEASLEFLLKDYDLIYGRRTQLEVDVRASFLRFMACLLKGYRSFLLPITQAPSERTRDSSNLFNLEGFRKSRDRTHQKFYSQLVKTQMFTQFIEDCSFVSDRHASLEFFDNCLEKVMKCLLERRIHTYLCHVYSGQAGLPPHVDLLLPPLCPRYDSFPILQRDLFDLPQDQLLVPSTQPKSSAPSSPAPRRTKQEIKSAQRVAQKYSSVPEMWAKCLLGHCYGLWFIYLPTFVRATANKVQALQTAYDALKQMETKKVVLPDEVCYRILMQLCGQYGEPVLAVRVMLEMRKAGIVPNTITYGYYNKAVLESKWPSASQSGRLRWAKLRNVVLGAAQFRQPIKHREFGSQRLHIDRADSPPDQPHGKDFTSSVSLGSEVDLSDTSVSSFAIHKSTDRLLDGSQELPAVEVVLSSCSPCPKCRGLVYDEDIMAGWTSDDSNLKSVCSLCEYHFVPSLNQILPEAHVDGAVASVSLGPVLSDRYQCLQMDEGGSMVTVAYLCPLVLRKELESLLENEGGDFLSQAELVNSHPIIYWNLVWYFQRLGLPSNLVELVLESKHIRQPSQVPELQHVNLHLLWDVLVQDPDRWPPLYIIWKLHSECYWESTRSNLMSLHITFLEKILNFIGMNEVHKAISLLTKVLYCSSASHYLVLYRGIYREMLLLTLAALGREHMDIAAFDNKYKTAFRKLGSSLGKEELRKKQAQLPSAKALECRKTFGATLEC